MGAATLIGLVLAGVGIVGGMILEGGNLRQIAQMTAALIVFGGTFGAVLVSFPLSAVRDAVQGLRFLFTGGQVRGEALIQEIMGYATRARRDGLLALEDAAEEASDPLLTRALSLAIDGNDAATVRSICELELEHLEEELEHAPKVWEAAGGYSPTIGIIGAVIGLIQVMQHLDDIEQVGHGIATAFVATIYGVAAANLLFLPAATKIKLAQRAILTEKEMIVEGVLSIMAGLNPRLVEERLRAFLPHRGGAKGKAAPKGAR